ncbi:hypothetical protein H4582DRAFT_428214 [Lactarius indigo]|nr:hypothetical protein H4582DRAFT_428214 [Lactarius indigo]
MKGAMRVCMTPVLFSPGAGRPVWLYKYSARILNRPFFSPPPCSSKRHGPPLHCPWLWSGADSSGCSLTDTNCICTNQTFATTAGGCIATECTSDEIDAAQAYLLSICGAAAPSSSIPSSDFHRDGHVHSNRYLFGHYIIYDEHHAPNHVYVVDRDYS